MGLVHDVAPANKAFVVGSGAQVTRMIAVDPERHLVGLLSHRDLMGAVEEPG